MSILRIWSICHIVSYGNTVGGPQGVGMLGDITGDTPDVFLAAGAPAATPRALSPPLELLRRASTSYPGYASSEQNQ